MDTLTSIKALKDDNSSHHPMFNVAGAPLEGKSSTENNPIPKENAVEDGEISIFDAEKYFSGECINESKEQGGNLQKSSSLPSSDGYGRSFMAKSCISESKEQGGNLQKSSSLPSSDGYGRSFMAKSTPSASSEASWNSQRALLSKNFAWRRSSKRWSAAKNWLFRRNCCCINGKSVGVKEAASISNRRAPIVLIDTEKLARRDGDQSHEQISPTIANDVVEVRQIRAMDFPRQQRISATGRPFISGAVSFTFPISDRAAIAREDDAGSDASSDLFEIESFSTQAIASLVDDDSNRERKFMPAIGVGNFHRSRLSVAEKEWSVAAVESCGRTESSSDVSVAALRPQLGEAGGGEEGKRTSNGMIPVICRPENAAEGPPVIALLVGGRPLSADKPRRGRSQSSPLVAAG